MNKAFVLIIALAGFNLQAATIITVFNGELTSENINRKILDDPTAPGYPSNIQFITTSTGEFSLTRTGGTEIGGPSGTFFGFCIEPREFVSQGSTYTYTFSYLYQGATNIGGMGPVKAAEIDELFGRYYPDFTVSLDADHASALQIAVWEIVRETSGTLNVHNGNVTYQNPANPAVDTNAMTIAQTYLASLNGTGPKLTNLYALTAVGAQDVVVQVNGSFQSPVPEPVTLVTTGAALIGLGLFLRRRNASRRAPLA
ncbi:MAG TPA: hypothetical protein VGZ73_24570 [Bryobacteraceae bacterium]|nr:hypothetical protein [Bryobacteraceae bacterium]